MLCQHLEQRMERLSDCREQKGTVVMKERKIIWNKTLIAAAAALALVVGLGGGFGWYQYTNTPMAAVSLDVNPSIQLEVNRKEKVLVAEALNQDAQVVLNGMDLKGTDMDVAINAILGSMLKNNFLTADANTVLVSVNAKDTAKAASLQEKLTVEIGQTLSANHFTGAVMGQTVTNKGDVQTLAQQHGISEGKAQLIQKLLGADSHYTFESLAKLSVNELKLLTERKDVQLADVSTSGQASNSQYVGRDTAANAALAHAGATKEQIRGLEVEFDCDDGRMLYEVEFRLDGNEYNVDIDAQTGKVLHMEREGTDNSDQKENVSTTTQSYITSQQAISKALSHVGLSKADVRDTDCELDRDGGAVHYDVEFETNTYEYKCEIDAVTGKVLQVSRDRQDDADNRYDDRDNYDD